MLYELNRSMSPAVEVWRLSAIFSILTSQNIHCATFGRYLLLASLLLCFLDFQSSPAAFALIFIPPLLPTGSFTISSQLLSSPCFDFHFRVIPSVRFLYIIYVRKTFA